jgi:hypothetical protein
MLEYMRHSFIFAALMLLCTSAAAFACPWHGAGGHGAGGHMAFLQNGLGAFGGGGGMGYAMGHSGDDVPFGDLSAPALDAPSTLLTDAMVLERQDVPDYDAMRERFLSQRPQLRALAEQATAATAVTTPATIPATTPPTKP